LDKGLEGTPEEVEAVTDVIAKIYK